uniref:Protein arginine N-methyltransferase n=1 Tax=Homalodisca liturata TaxID=320908 RepID=A0A1B6I934_9HEMI
MSIILQKVQISQINKKTWDIIIESIRNMNIFTKKLNPLTGAVEWVMQNENYDFNQEIARSAFADMLHDSERNEKYYTAIKKVIEQTHRAGKKAHVLDIGTGTGLLAMMAARCGADTIHACEAFSPISQCAEEVIRENGLVDRIRVIHKRSTEMTAGDGGDIPHRANILVTEVFDTELIGEGAIATFNHAHKHLLEKDCLVVPTSGTVYAQVVESAVMQRWNRLDPWGALKLSGAVAMCPGAAAVHDLQLSQLKLSDFNTIAPPQPVFSFDFSGRSSIPEDDSSTITFTAVASGSAEVVFMWWSLDMDPQGSVVLSCAPWWAHPAHPPGPDSIPWRDHWMQAAYYLPAPLPVRQGQQLSLISSHDEFSLWFNLTSTSDSPKRSSKRPLCDCMLHVTCSRTRVGMLNDTSRRDKYRNVLHQLITPQTVVLSWGDTSLLGLMAATLGAKQVYHVEENSLSREVIEGLVKDNKLKSKVTILDSTKLDDKIRSSVNLVVGEPYFLNSLYPWDVLRWWFLRQQCPTASCVPVAATLHCLPMQFDHLHKIRAPLGTISGFKMSAFDKLIQSASTVSDTEVEVQPLWEYPGVCLSASHQLISFDLTTVVPQSEVEVRGTITTTVSGTCHGVALWLDVHLDSHTVVSTGPQSSPQPGQRVSWDPYCRQGVYFFLPQVPVTSQSHLDYKAVFSPTTGEITFNFAIQK